MATWHQSQVTNREPCGLTHFPLLWIQPTSGFCPSSLVSNHGSSRCPHIPRVGQAVFRLMHMPTSNPHFCYFSCTTQSGCTHMRGWGGFSRKASSNVLLLIMFSGSLQIWAVLMCPSTPNARSWLQSLYIHAMFLLISTPPSVPSCLPGESLSFHSTTQITHTEMHTQLFSVPWPRSSNRCVALATYTKCLYCSPESTDWTALYTALHSMLPESLRDVFSNNMPSVQYKILWNE